MYAINRSAARSQSLKLDLRTGLLALSTSHPDPLGALATLWDLTSKEKLFTAGSYPSRSGVEEDGRQEWANPEVLRYIVLIHDSGAGGGRDGWEERVFHSIVVEFSLIFGTALKSCKTRFKRRTAVTPPSYRSSPPLLHPLHHNLAPPTSMHSSPTLLLYRPLHPRSDLDSAHSTRQMERLE